MNAHESEVLTRTPCPDCNGSGKREAEQAREMLSQLPPPGVIDPSRGLPASLYERLEAAQRCPRCEGSGYVETWVSAREWLQQLVDQGKALEIT